MLPEASIDGDNLNKDKQLEPKIPDQLSKHPQDIQALLNHIQLHDR